MLIVYFVFIVVFMTKNTTEDIVVAGIGMAIGTNVPFIFMFATVNREVQNIVIECGWDPSIYSMACLTICWKLCSLVIRICGIVVIIEMTSDAGIWSIVIISIVTCGAIVFDCEMRTQ